MSRRLNRGAVVVSMTAILLLGVLTVVLASQLAAPPPGMDDRCMTQLIGDPPCP